MAAELESEHGALTAHETRDEACATTLRDVAHASGVSTSTVSRFLNGQLRLRPSTKERVERAITSLNYVPNSRAYSHGAGSKVGRQLDVHTAVIAMLVPEMDNLYYGRIVDCVVEEAERHGLGVLLCSTRNQTLRQETYIDLLLSGAISGLLYLGSHQANKRLATAISDGLPVVVLDEPIMDLPPVDCVVMDDYAGAFQATSHLLQIGHRRIAFVAGPAELGSVKERRRGYHDALANAGIDMDPQLTLYGSFSEQFGMSAMPHLMRGSATPTAVFAASDLIALGFLAAADTHGIRIPDDLSIVGFDDLRFAEYVRPRLTTVHSPIDRLAQLGVTLLYDRLQDRVLEARSEVLPVSLVVRNSTVSPSTVQPAVAGRSADQMRTAPEPAGQESATSRSADTPA
jgi:DNA-binding LacI/PurR family transcriptional regulator